MFVGSFLLDYLPSETKTEDNLLFNIEDGKKQWFFPYKIENQRLKSISQIIPSISTYFLTKILPVQGCSWSISLLQVFSRQNKSNKSLLKPMSFNFAG